MAGSALIRSSGSREVTPVVRAGTPCAMSRSPDPLATWGVPAMSPPDPTPFETFEQLCHDVSNPLMVVSGHAHLIERYVLRLTDLPDGERAQIMAELALLKANVHEAVLLLNQQRRLLEDEGEYPGYPGPGGM